MSNDSNLFRDLQKALLDCGPFASDTELQSIFEHPLLESWHDDLPEADNPVSRVRAVIEFLMRLSDENGMHPLGLFLFVLQEQSDISEKCSRRLARLSVEHGIVFSDPAQDGDSQDEELPITRDIRSPVEHFVPSPSPSVDVREILEGPAGVVRLESKFYIERGHDALLRRQVLANGTTTTIRAPRQMGKTSLLVRGVQHAREAGQGIVYVDFQKVDSQFLGSLDGLLRYLADEIAFRLKLDQSKVDKAWDSPRGPQDKLNAFMEMYVLPAVEVPILLAIDEADQLLNAPYKTNFFALLRAWDTQRAINSVWEKLNIVLVISTYPYYLIPDVNQSPFNVGVEIYLDDFNETQVAALNRQHESPLQPADIPELMAVLGGHPYLTRQALYTLVDKSMSWAELSSVALSDNGPFGRHLRYHLWQLRNQPDLKQGLQDVLLEKPHSNQAVLDRLIAIGLVTKSNGHYLPRCGLYGNYFRAKLQ